MANEQTLVLIKPDAMLMGNNLAIQEVYERAGLRIIMGYELQFSRDDAESFYQDHVEKFYFAGLILAISSGPCYVLLLESENAIELVRELNGPTDPAKAPPGTIRHDFRSAGGPFNTVHASDSKEAFAREHAFVMEKFYNLI
jgi:nucleoside-diphosphate kinase